MSTNAFIVERDSLIWRIHDATNAYFVGRFLHVFRFYLPVRSEASTLPGAPVGPNRDNLRAAHEARRPVVQATDDANDAFGNPFHK